MSNDTRDDIKEDIIEVIDITEEEAVPEAADSSNMENNEPVETPEAPTKKPSRTGDIIRYIVMGICIVVFCVALFKLIGIFRGYKKAADELSDIKDLVFSEATTSSNTTANIEDPSAEDTTTAPVEDVPPYMKAFPSIDFDKLKSLNSEAVMWIEIAGMDISFPVAQGSDNDFYLDHSFLKDHNLSGAIFLDYRNNADLSDPNSFVYGHRMTNGSMFYPLLDYDNEETYRKLEAQNKNYIYVYMPGKVYVYKIFCITDVTMAENPQAYHLVPADQLASQIEYYKSLQRYDTGITPPEGTPILTLYTCQDRAQVSNVRHLTHSYLVDIIER